MAYRGHYAVTKRQSRFYVLSILASICLSLLAIVSYFKGVSSFLGDFVNVVLTPVNSACAYVVENVVSVRDYFTDMTELKKENLMLKAENDALLKDTAKAEAVLAENEELYAFLGLKKEFTDLSLVNAKIIVKGSGSFMTTFTIDKGTIHGVYRNMPIMSKSGILGIVSEEGLTTSRCISLVSHNASAGVYILRTGVPGILEGDYALSADGLCKISGLGTDSDIVEGDYVYTSGYGEIFPKDICVGTVTEIIRDASTHTLTAIVTPACDPDNVDTVMVITDFERKYEEPAAPESDEQQ